MESNKYPGNKQGIAYFYEEVKKFAFSGFSLGQYMSNETKKMEILNIMKGNSEGETIIVLNLSIL